MQRARRWLALIAFSCLAEAQADPQEYVELRAAYAKSGWYRFAEYTHTFRNRVLVDFVYLGVPGQNELYAGAGYQFRVSRTLTFTPLLYAVVGKENGQRGLAVGAFAAGGLPRGWNLYSFAGVYAPVAGSVRRYFFLDSLDLSRPLETKSWELGGSLGLFQSQGQTTALAGPMLVRNDKRGAWKFYVRGGSQLEARAVRTFVF